MVRILKWLGRNKLIAVLLGIITYFSIVSFHDEITDLAVKLRRGVGLDKYNEYFAYGFIAILIITLIIFIYYSLKERQKLLKLSLMVIVLALTLVAFRFLMIYNIEAIHFVEYMLLAMILLPVIRSYGETVFWVTILGILDELFQYRFLTPNFEYFDFNDNILNLIGAGAGAVMIYISGGNAVQIRKMKWYRSPAVLTGLGLLIIFIFLLISGKMTINPPELPGSDTWFWLNRKKMPEEFWTIGYPGRNYHILRPTEGIFLMYLLFAGFFGLDKIRVNPQKSASSAC
jgi:hypothetical protein